MKLITTKKLADQRIVILIQQGIPVSRVGSNRIHIEIQKPDKKYPRYFTNEELIVYSMKVEYAIFQKKNQELFIKIHKKDSNG